MPAEQPQPKHIVVVGASLAGLRAVEAAREEGFTGKLTLIGAEEHLPYDRPPLSKEYLGVDAIEAPHFPGIDELRLELDLEIMLGTPASDLNIADRTVRVGINTISYDQLIIATGAAAREMPGTDHLRGVYTLRTLTDADSIRAGLDSGARTVVIGAGFIGSEIASSARKRGLTATVIEALPTPLVRAVGQYAGTALSRLHERNGTDLRCGVGVSGLEGDDHVTGVRMQDGSLVPADLVIVGIGTIPSTGWLDGSGLTIENGIVSDVNLAAASGVWAAGDVARWMSPDFDQLMRLEHWTNAGDQGAHAMRNALSPVAPLPYSHIPYFWSDWYDSRIQFAGLSTGEPVVVSGSWEGDNFVALYRDRERLVGVLTLNRRADIMKYRALIARRGTWDDGLALAASRESALAGRRA